MGFGFFGKYTVRQNFTYDGTTITGTGRTYGFQLCQRQQIGDNNAHFHFEYDASNSTPVPDNQTLISNTNVPFSNDHRCRATYAITNNAANSVYQLFLLAVNSRFFRYTATTLKTRSLILTFNRPELIDIWTSAYLSGFISVYQVPYLINCRHMQISTANAGASLTTINGTWPEGLQYLDITNATTTLTTIQRAFPSSLKGLILAGGSNATLGNIANINNLLSQCANLLHLCFKQPIFERDNIRTTLVLQAGTLNISHMPLLETLMISGASTGANLLTNITYSFTALKVLFFTGMTNFNTTTFRAIANIAMATPTLEFFNISYSSQTWTRSFTNADLPLTCKQFYMVSNIITGTISLTAARPNTTGFNIGVFGTAILSAAQKNNFSTVDISGLTAVTILDLSNSQIQDLTLPLNTVCTDLYLGGNKLSVTTNPNLISQINAMTGLITLRCNSGTSTNTGMEVGQNSTDGLGANPTFTLPSLATLSVNSCKITGTLKIPFSLSTLIARDNPGITTIDGPTSADFSSMLSFNVSESPSFVGFDFARLKKFTTITLANVGVGPTIDLSGRDSVAVIGAIQVTGTCPNITTIILPANTANCVFSGNTSGAVLQCSLNPSVNSIQNLEKINYSTLTGVGRIITLNGCSLNQDLKFGVNNFLPTAITCQNNGMSQANVDLNLKNLYDAEVAAKYATTTAPKSINIGGTNAAPSGTYANVATPTTGNEYKWKLVNVYSWTVTSN